MERITITELQERGYTLDYQAQKSFENKWGFWCVPLALAVIFSLMGGIWDWIPYGLGWILAAASLFSLWGVMAYAGKAPVVSRHSGKVMKKYENAHPDDKVVHEVVCVCKESKTYFTRVWSVESDV